MKTIVTGGTGFIGSHLVNSLLKQGREVIVVSDLAHLGIENLTDLGVRTSDIELRRADLSDYHQALKAMEGANCVFHLAARVGSLEYLHGSELAELAALQTNLVIDANIFRACLEKKVRKLIYASSVAVYPMDKQYSPGAVFSEDDLEFCQNQPRIINPDGGYGWAKLMGEIELNWMKGIDIGIARIFNIYGENEPLGEKAHVIADLIQKAILYPKEEFIVRGDGKQSRDFLYVSDCINALLRLEEKISNLNESQSNLYESPLIINIGSGKPVSIGTIAQKIVSLSGKDIKIAYDSTRSVGPISRTADITKAKALLSWRPKVSLDDGLRHTYFWIQKYKKAEK
ncbi:NAD-dependent epimerase/dehydratase family protein [Dehalococcoidia bacterium]|nr:NAD-dependent epimerase/dehydratase family protein [Dehalococcoidia bacterium]